MESGKRKVPRVSPQRLAEAAGKWTVESGKCSMGLSTFSNQARRAQGKQAGRESGLVWRCRKDRKTLRRKLEAGKCSVSVKKSPGVTEIESGIL